MRTFIKYALYPILLALVLAVTLGTIRHDWDTKLVYGLVTLALVLILVTVESLFPLKQEWKMTKGSFLRDLSYILIDGPTIAISRALFGMLAIWYSEQHEGLFSQSNILICTILYLLTFEFFQYWYHRLSHTGKGKLGKFLWRVHVAHHLPDKVYVVMHAVFHPINAILTVIIIQTPLVLLGIPPEAAFAASLIIDLQGLVAHFNADIRAGWFNYVFIGTETHRYHHSANLDEAQNYGSVLAIWDIVFGTFRYNPKVVPERLGVEDPNNYPASGKLLKVLTLPFQK